jgi:hypothetical protein
VIRALDSVGYWTEDCIGLSKGITSIGKMRLYFRAGGVQDFPNVYPVSDLFIGKVDFQAILIATSLWNILSS